MKSDQQHRKDVGCENSPPVKYRLNSRIVPVVAQLDRFFYALFDSASTKEWKPDLNGQRILVLRTDHIGDMVLSSSFFRNLKLSFPNAEVTVVCRKINEELARLMPGVDRVEVMNTPWLARGDRWSLGTILRSLRNSLHRFDLALDLHPHPFNIILGKILAKRMVGFNFRGLGFLLDLALCDSPPGTHVVDRNLRLVKAIGGSVDDPALHLRVLPENTQRVRALLTELAIKSNNFIVIVHPEAGMPSKEWPSHSFSALVELLTAFPATEVVLVAKDVWRVTNIINGMNRKERVHNLAGKLNLLELVALIKESKLLIGLESMPAHIAASVGTPVVELHSGQSSADEWGVYQGNFEIVSKRIECAPCGKSKCEDNRCMKLITPSEVLASAKRLSTRVYGHESPFR